MLRKAFSLRVPITPSVGETTFNRMASASRSQLLLRCVRSQYRQHQPIRCLHVTNARYKSRGAINTCILFVPEREAWVIERFGKFNRILSPGLNFVLPIVERIRYVQSMKELVIDIPEQTAITSDNVSVSLDGVLYLKIVDAYRASYGVQDAEYAIKQLAQTTMRSEIGKIALDTVFRERELLNSQIVAVMNKASEDWGLSCLRYEIRDLILQKRVQDAMQLQVEAERKKRATILESEGIRDAEINVGEGKRCSKILASEAQREEVMNIAIGEARAIEAIGKAQALSLEIIIQALNSDFESSQRAVAWQLAQSYIEAFEKLAKETNTVVLPANAGDVVGMVTQALTTFSAINRSLGAGKSCSSPPKHRNHATTSCGNKSEAEADDNDLPSRHGSSWILESIESLAKAQIMKDQASQKDGSSGK